MFIFKKLLTISLILCLMLTLIPFSAFAKQPSGIQTEKKALLKKYSAQFKEMEAELAKMEAQGDQFIQSEGVESPNGNIITRTVEEDNSIVTLGIVYTQDIDFVGGTKYITHAKVYIKSTYTSGENINGHPVVSLTKVEGNVIELSDGAELVRIDITAGQESVLDPLNAEHDSFYTTNDYYSKSYNWPDLLWPNSGTKTLGHNAKYTLYRGYNQDYTVEAKID